MSKPVFVKRKNSSYIMKRWIKKEDVILKEMCLNNYSYKEIAKKLNRTPISCNLRRFKMKFEKKKLFNELNVNWKGNDVGYYGIHAYIKRHKPKPEVCEICRKNKPYDLANKSGKYLRNVDDYEWICRSCHMNEDGRMNNLSLNSASGQERR